MKEQKSLFEEIEIRTFVQLFLGLCIIFFSFILNFSITSWLFGVVLVAQSLTFDTGYYTRSDKNVLLFFIGVFITIDFMSTCVFTLAVLDLVLVYYELLFFILLPLCIDVIIMITSVVSLFLYFNNICEVIPILPRAKRIGVKIYEN